MLKSIEIENFKKIKHLKLDQLAPINYLVGENGSGKSSVLSLLDIWLSKIDHQEMQDHIDKGFLHFIDYNWEKNSGLNFGKTILHLDFDSNSNYSNFQGKLSINFPNQRIDTEEHLKYDNKRALNKYRNTPLLFSQNTFDLVYADKILNLSDSNFTRFCDFLNKNWVLHLAKYFPKYDMNLARTFGDQYYTYKALSLREVENFERRIFTTIPSGYQLILGLYISIMFDSFIKEFDHESTPYILIEEPENFLHPSLQKQIPHLIEFLNKYSQFIISTHSPFIISAALRLENQKVYHLEDGQVKSEFDKNSLITSNGVEFDDVLSSLGFEMKDIYYPECLIYVEGPVDVLYINYWLNKYMEDQEIEFNKGVHFDFVEYGGSLASHLTMDFNIKTGEFNELKTDKLVNIFSLNRQIFFITDSDSDKQGAFEKAKQKIEDKILSNKASGRKCEFHKDSKIITIEDYLTDISEISKNKTIKVEAALVNLKNWKKNNIGLDAFKPELKKLLYKLYNFIKSCN